MKMKKTVLLTIMAMFCAWPVYGAVYPTSGATQNAYCQVPPYLTSNVKPNINLVLDFSGSMQFPAYLDCTNWGGYDGSKVADCGSYTNPAAKFLYTPFNVDGTSRDYYGNFKSNTYYKYNAGGYFEENPACTDTDRKGQISTGCVSGNLLNWAVTTRTDVLRKILTGGRVKAATADVLESEGARYIFTDTALHCKFTVTAVATTTRLLKVENQSSSTTCAIGTGSGYNMDVKTTTPTTDITGVIQSMYPNMVDLELSVYNTTANVAYRTGKNKLLANYVAAINTELAYNGTPTGEAVREAQYFFQQSTSLATKNENGQTTTGDKTDDVLSKANFLMDPYYETGNLPAPCKKSYVLLISDGAWNGSVDPVNPAHYMRKTDLRTELAGSQNVRTYTVYAFGDEVTGRQAMITTALFGGYDDDDANGWPYPFTALPSDSKDVTYPRSNCDPSGTPNAKCAEWDREKTGLPSNFYEASDGAALQAAIAKAIQDIQANTSSGTAASVMGNNDSSGAMLLQALYFPEKSFEASTKARWLGEIQAFWYYVDPLLKYINIREDTLSDNKLKLENDRIASFDFEGSQTRVNLYDDADGDGSADTPATAAGNVLVDDVKALWRAGKSLWSRPAIDRTIYVNDPTVTTTNQGSRILFDATATNLAKLKPYLDVASVDADATNVINHTLGNYIAGYRDKRVTIGGTTNVWKLGDVIGSTPRMLTPVSINSYDLAQGGYRDKSYDKFVNSKVYKERNLAIAGANDGILHAFKTGKNTALPATAIDKKFLSELKNGDGTTIPLPVNDLGKELWGFVPKNVLPYLKHLGNPGYSHLYFVNSSPYLIDASIQVVDKKCSNDPLKGCSVNADCGTSGSPAPTCDPISPACTGSDCPKIDKSWRTVMIGSMGLGGATRDKSAACTDCVKTPVSGSGYSSYFALDVTDSANPQLLWEFSNPRLGFSTVGPAVMRIRDSSDTTSLSIKNGNWYVVLASGPTGPIDSVTNQMKGLSDQPLSLFVLDLKTGAPVRTFSRDAAALITGVGHTTAAAMPDLAFGGSLYNAPIDADKWDTNRPGAYSDDGLYLGYTRKDTTAGSPSLNKFAKGGILRLLTGDLTPADWKVSTVIDGIGPVTSSVTKLQNNYDKELWLFFGTGRYFYKSGSTIDEDYTGQQEAIYGIKDPCYVKAENDLSNPACTAPVSLAIKDQTISIQSDISTYGGWKINLAQAAGTFNAQRITTNPTASSLGTLFFVAMKPTADICSYGGTSSVWTINYNNGDAPSAALKGVVLLQKTTGATESIGLGRSASSGGTIVNSGNREGAQGTGLTGQDTPPVDSNADHSPSKKILHIQER
jgi:type IV pilus assembly protein PilY1